MLPHQAEQPTAEEIAQNLQAVRQRIADAARRAGRRPDEVSLVAVSKTKPLALVEAALAAGQLDFGENRVEELWEKVERAQERDLPAIRWHLIGTIQSRKSRQAVGPFVLIHTVDRIKIARRLSRDAQEAGQVMPVLLEINVSKEETKYGFAAAEVPDLVPALASLPGIQIHGLMTMAPFVDNPEVVRPVFRRLHTLRDQLQAAYPQVDWRHLSMGMTNDFEVAIEEGATIVRVGTAIFGSRV